MMIPIKGSPLSACLLLFLASQALSSAARPAPAGKTEFGLASVYHDRRTASGEPFLPHRYTGAHRTLPFGSYVRVTAPRTGRSTIVRINDRGPFVKGRIIDLSPAAAASLGLTKKLGTTRVEVLHLPAKAPKS